MLTQVRQQCERSWCKVDGLAVTLQAAGPEVEHEGAEVQRGRRVAGGGGGFRRHGPAL